MGTKFGMIVPEVNTHRFTESDFLCSVIISRHYVYCIMHTTNRHLSTPANRRATATAGQRIAVLELLSVSYRSVNRLELVHFSHKTIMVVEIFHLQNRSNCVLLL